LPVDRIAGVLGGVVREQPGGRGVPDSWAGDAVEEAVGHSPQSLLSSGAAESAGPHELFIRPRRLWGG